MSDTAQKHIVIDARSRSSSTGSGRYADRLLTHLQAIDSHNHYTVLVRDGDAWSPAVKNFKALPCPFRQFSFNLLDQITFARFLYKLHPDLVHFCMAPQEPMFYFGKRVTTAHDLTMFEHVRPGRLPIWLHKLRMVGYRLLFWWSLRLAKHILVPSNFVGQDIGKKYPFCRSKITVTYEASEPPLAEAAQKPKGVAPPFITHVGSPFPHKNIERLVEALIELKKHQPQLKLVLVGKKEQYFEKLEAFAKATPVASDVIFTGYVSDAELKWLFGHAEAYILPSLSEGFGLPGLEAMTYRCPLLSSTPPVCRKCMVMELCTSIHTIH